MRAWGALRNKLAMELKHATLDADLLAARPGATTTPAHYFAGLARALLNTHTLRAYATLYLDTAAQMLPAAAAQSGSGASGSQAGRDPPRRAVTAALEQLKEGCEVLSAIMGIAEAYDYKEPDAAQPLPLPLPFAVDRHQPLAKLLCHDVDESGFLEGWCRLLLAVSSCEAAEDEVPRLLHTMAIQLGEQPRKDSGRTCTCCFMVAAIRVASGPV